VCLNVDGLTPSKALDQEWYFRSNINMLHLLLVCIVWHIKPILKYKPSQTYLWFFTLKISYNGCMIILIISFKGIWNLPNW
jgi:hypothetical protein